MKDYRNVFTVDGYPLLSRLEGAYWQEVLEHLEIILKKDFYRYKFVFYSLPTHAIPNVEQFESRNTVLIVLGDNSGRHYLDHFKNIRIVFKVHLTEIHGHVFPVPLGYTNMHLHGCTEPILNRPLNVFFSGNINANRVDLWRSLRFKNPIPKHNIKSRWIRRGIVYTIRKLKLKSIFNNVFPDSQINFTQGFASGLDAETYTRCLAETKISLSPAGFGSAECFRHFEALRSGNIVISAPLPDNWYFKGSPIIQISSWSSLRNIVNSLLSDSYKIEQLQDECINWWKDVCSPLAVAHYMASRIASSVSPEERLAATAMYSFSTAQIKN